jgi:protein TonB
MIAIPDSGVGPPPSDHGRRRWLFLASIVCSLSLHVALAAALMRLPASSGYGSGGHVADAIGVELVSSATLESVLTRAAPAVAALPAASLSEQPPDVERTEIAAQTPRAEPEPEPRAEPERGPELPEEPAALEPAPKASEAPTPDVKPAVTVTEPVAIERAEARGTDAAQQEAQAASVAQAASARASTAGEGVAGAASASPGDVERFTLEVRQAIGRAGAAHAGFRGKVRVAFSLDEDGMMRSSAVLQSSGRSRVDEMALAALQKARFPAPPKGLSELQRTYHVTFEFQ